MDLLRKKRHQNNLAVILIVVLIFFGYISYFESNHEIPVRGAIYFVHRSDGSYKTYIDVAIGHKFAGRVPDDIDSIVVFGPNGILPIDLDDFKYNPQLRSFWTVKPGPPEVGSYTFKVSSGKNSGQAIDNQSTVKKIPLPETQEFNPINGETITCTPTTFSWKELNVDGPIFYQIEIRDANRQHVYRTPYVQGMKSVRLPAEILRANYSYQWRIKAADGADWRSMNNRSQSPWVSFSTNETLNTCKYQYHEPIPIDGNWEVSSLDKHKVNKEKIQELMYQIYANKIKNIHSILLIKNGKLILEEYFDGYHRNLKHHIASVTKSVTSILIGIAKNKGFEIDIDKKLIDYLPEYKDILSKGVKRDITLKHLLTMRAGLEWDEFSHSNFQYLYYESDDAIKYILEKKPVDPPGQRFVYSTGLSTVLGRIIKNTTGYDADRFAADYLFTPLGISDYFWGKAHDGTVLTGSSLHLRPRDMARLGYLFLKDGVWNGKQIVSLKWVRESISPHVTYPYDKGDLISGTGYGYQWWRGKTKIADTDIGAFYAAGHGGQFICIIPSLDTIIIITSQVDNNDAGDFRAYSAIDNYILPALLQTKDTSKIPSFDVNNYHRITGKYQWSKADLNLKIFIDSGKIFGKTILFDDKFEIVPVEKNRFMCLSKDVGKFFLDTIEDSNGNIESLQLIIGFSYIPFNRERGLLF